MTSSSAAIDRTPFFSVVIPFFDEEAAIPDLLAEVLEVMDGMGRSYECLCVDDGSSDGTAERIRFFAERPSSTVRMIQFSENRGQGAALYRGLQEANGEIVITLDGDGQNHPGDIPMLLELLESNDLVCGIRAERKDSWLRRSMSRLANSVRGWLLQDGVRDAGCALKVMRREVVYSLIPLKTLYSFIPAMAAAAGFRNAELSVRHRQRQGGKTSYGLLVFLWRPLVDLMGLVWYRRRCTLTPEDCRSAAARDAAR
ncbi:MAG: glycosyltransferase [Nitrospirae bacterium]|nr:glycosyltransferase [Nitrospirota bacterium]